MIMSRYPILSEDELMFSYSVFGDDDAQNGVLYAEV